MASKIVPTNVDGTFPVAGQDNSSQGFRDNFTNIKNNFSFAASEITDLQENAILKGALSGTTLNNDMAGTQLTRPQLKAWTQASIDLGAASGIVNFSFNNGNFQKLTTAGSISVQLSDWPSTIGSGAFGYGVMRIWLVVTSVSHAVALPSSVSIGSGDIAGSVFNPITNSYTLTFDTPGNYVFDISTVDGGSTYLLFDITRNRVQFRDPSFYFNEAVSPTFLIGFQDALPLAILLSTGNDTLQLRGSQTNYAGVPEHGNDPGQGIASFNPIYAGLSGNANTAGYSVGTSRAYIDGNTGLPVINAGSVVQSNDYIGYYDFLGATANPANIADLSICDFGTIRGFVNGSSPFSPGGNIQILTKRDLTFTSDGTLAAALSVENDQSTRFYGDVHVGKNIVKTSTIVRSFATSGDTFVANASVSTLIIDSTGSNTISIGNVRLPTSPVNGQTFTISTVAPITSANVFGSNGFGFTYPVRYVPANAFASGNVRIELTFVSNVWYRS